MQQNRDESHDPAVGEPLRQWSPPTLSRLDASRTANNPAGTGYYDSGIWYES
jgi:hypothetical protein